MNASSQFLFDGLQLRSHTVAPGFPFDLEFTSPRLAADEGEAQEVESLRLAEPAPLATFRRTASKLDQPGLHTKPEEIFSARLDFLYAPITDFLVLLY